MLFSLPVLWIRVSGVCLCSGRCPAVAGSACSWLTCCRSVEESMCFPLSVSLFLPSPAVCSLCSGCCLWTSVQTLLDFVAFRLAGFNQSLHRTRSTCSVCILGSNPFFGVSDTGHTGNSEIQPPPPTITSMREPEGEEGSRRSSLNET